MGMIAPARRIVAETITACASMAGLPYDGEPVDQLQHALQAAALARRSERREDPEFVVACLLHDIARAPAVAGLRYDTPDEHHGAIGSRWLTPRYGDRVAWLAEQHVAAKRYLVTTDPTYRQALSPVSRETLLSQGGAMSTDELRTFEAHGDHQLAVELRRFDDRAKDEHLTVPGVAAYEPILLAVARRHGS